MGTTKNMKKLYPIETAEHSIKNSIDDEPAHQCLIPYVILKGMNIISKVKQRYKEEADKYGVKVQQTFKETYNFDKENDNDLWRHTIKREMSNAMVLFKLLDHEKNPPPCYEKV